MATLIVRIEMDNAAFVEDRERELAMIFAQLIRRVGGFAFTTGRLMDSNGNAIGTYSVGSE